jgi:hypothetical protein
LDFTEFAWNGFRFEAPEEARFTRYGGDTKKGSFILESEDYLIEAKWDPIPKRRASLSVVGTSLIEEMGVEYGKKRRRLSKRTITVLEKHDTHVFSHDALYMVAKVQVEERFYIWYCDESNRVVIVRFLFKTFDESSKKIVKQLLESLECHRKDFNVWSLLNVRFETPMDFLLTDSRIAVGGARFVLSGRKLTSFTEKTSTIVVEYYSMANVVFEDTYNDLDVWFRKNHEKDIYKQFKKRRIRFRSIEPRKLMKHDLIMKEATGKSGTSWRSTTHFTNASWYCSESNRIYSITLASSISKPLFLKRQINETEYTELMGNLLSSFKCH